MAEDNGNVPALPGAPKSNVSRRGITALLREAAKAHGRALDRASDAVRYAVAAGEALCAAREQCRAGDWERLIAENFPASLRTAQKYMRLARHFRLLSDASPSALTSQTNAAQALTSIMRGDSPAERRGGSRRTRRTRGASPVEPGPFLQMALDVLRGVESQLRQTAGQSYHVRHALETVQRGAQSLAQLASHVAATPCGAQPLDCPVDADCAADVDEALRRGLDETA